MWVLAFAKCDNVPEEDKVRMNQLFDFVIDNPATFDLGKDIEAYKDLCKSQRDQEKRESEAQLRKADRKERQDKKKAAELKAADELKKDKESRWKKILDLRESVLKFDQSFHFEAPFLPQFMQEFLKDFDIKLLSKEIKSALDKDLSNESDDRLHAIETFLLLISKLAHRQSESDCGDPEKNRKQCDDIVKKFQDTGGAKVIFSRMLVGHPLSNYYLKATSDVNSRDDHKLESPCINNSSIPAETAVETVDEEDSQAQLILPAKSSVIRSFGHDEYLAICASVLQHDPENAKSILILLHVVLAVLLMDFDTMTLVLAKNSQTMNTLVPQVADTNIGHIGISNTVRDSSKIISDDPRAIASASSIHVSQDASTQKSSASHGIEGSLRVSQQPLNFTEVEKKPEHFDAATEGQIRMARVRSLLEDVAHPILEQLLRLQWQKSGGSYCPKCERIHPFEDILILKCISYMTSSSSLSPYASVFKAIELVNEGTTVAQLSSGFDVTSIIQIIQAWSLQPEFKSCEKYFQSPHFKFKFFNYHLNPIVKWRNKSFHPLELSHEDYEECFNEVPDMCFRLYNILLDKNKDNKDKIFEEWKINFGDCWDRIKTCKISFTRLNIEKHMKEQWLLESKRSMLTEFGRYLESQCMEFSRNSKIVGERLCDSSNPSKFLIIPKLVETDTAKLRHRLEFLTKLSWAGIIDLNYPFLWSERGNLVEFLPMTIHFEDELINPADESSFGTTKTLYGESIRDISRLLQSHSQAYVVGFVEVDYGDEDGMERLKSVVQHFHDNDNVNKDSVWPLVEDVNLLAKTSFLWKTKKRGKRPPLINPTDPQELTDYTVSIFCSIDLVAAVVFGRQRRPQTILLNTNRKTRIGIPLGWIAQFSCVEVLCISSDVFPKYTSTVDCNIDFAKLESNKLQPDFDDSFIESEFRKVLKTESFNFLNGGEASWFLFKQDRYVVKRNQLEGVVDLMIRDRDHLRQITIVHKFGAGGTTFARHVLYILHTRGFVCLVVNDSIKGKKKIDNFIAAIRRLNALTDNKVVILIDLKRDRAEVSEPKIKFISIVKDKCHAFTTFMVTTSEEEWISYYRKDSGEKTRERSMEDLERVVVLESILKESEVADFGRLLKEVTKAKTVYINGVQFPVDQFGSPDLTHIKNSEFFMEIIRDSRPSELMDAGLSAFDLHELGVILHSGDGTIPSKSKSRMSFLGLLQFNLEFRDHVRKYIQRILDYLSYANPKDVQVLKLFVFYCLFTPTGAVERSLAQYVYNDNGRVSNQNMVWSSMLLEFIEVDHRNNPYLYLKSQQLGYLLAETKQLFGMPEGAAPGKNEHPALRISVESIRSYILSELFPIIFRDANDCNQQVLDSPAQEAALHRTLLTLVSEGLLHALCHFKIWHPGSKPNFSTSSIRSNDKYHQKATLDNAFLIELIIFGNRREGTNFVRTLFEKVIKEYGDCPKELGTFSTHAARFIAYQAQVRMTFELINEADKLVKDLPLDYKVAECLGNIRKREVLIYLKQSKYVNLPRNAATAKKSTENDSEDIDDEENDNDDDNSDDDQGYQLESQQPSDATLGSGDFGAWNTIPSSKRATSNNSKSISRPHSITSQINSDIDYDKLSKVLAITEEGSFMFDKAIIFHKSVNTHPMVASVQSWINFLKYFRNILLVDQDTFVALLFGKSTHVPPKLKQFLEKVQKLNIIEKCSRLLTSARKAILYKSMNSGYEYHDKSTMSFIKDNQQKLRGMLETKAERHQGMDKPPIHFNMTKARILLVRGNVSGLDDTELCYCFATCAIELVQRNSDFTVKRKNLSVQNTFDDSFYDTLEKFYLASSLITYCYLNGDRNHVSEKISLFQSQTPVSLSDAWSFRRLKEWFEGWSNFIKEQLRSGLQLTDDGREIKTFYGLDTKICIVLLYLWKVLQVELSPGEKTTFMSRLTESLKLLWDYSDGCQHAMVPRIFLGKKCAIRGNPFSQFIQAEQMKSQSVEIHRGDRESQEREYRNQAKLFKSLTGKFHVTSPANKNHVSQPSMQTIALTSYQQSTSICTSRRPANNRSFGVMTAVLTDQPPKFGAVSRSSPSPNKVPR
eukprot:gene22486-30747_t